MGDQTIYPAIRYRDATAAIAWLSDAFGATEHAVHRGDDGAVQHAELVIGTSIFMLGQHGAEPWLGGKPADPLAGTVSLYVVVEDPDAHHERALAAGATVVRKIEDTDYGSREFSVRDLEGNLWSFGTYSA